MHGQGKDVRGMREVVEVLAGPSSDGGAAAMMAEVLGAAHFAFGFVAAAPAYGAQQPA